MTQNPQDAISPPRVRLEGVLDVVKASDSSFQLILADGRTLPGRLVGYPITSMARLLGRPLLVFGTGRFGPAGELEGVEADGIVPNDDQPWTRSATDPPLSREVGEEMARRLQAAWANWKWPGDETDEEIQKALKELG
jgi:hypothetical protein